MRRPPSHNKRAPRKPRQPPERYSRVILTRDPSNSPEIAQVSSRRERISRANPSVHPRYSAGFLLAPGCWLLATSSSHPPRRRRSLADHDLIQERCRFRLSLVGRHQRILVLDRQHVIVAKHAEGRNK